MIFFLCLEKKGLNFHALSAAEQCHTPVLISVEEYSDKFCLKSSTKVSNRFLFHTLPEAPNTGASVSSPAYENVK